MCSGLLLASIIKIKQATIPLTVKILSNSLMKPSLVSPGASWKFCNKNLGLLNSMLAIPSVDGTLPFEPKSHKRQEACSMTFRCDTKQNLLTSFHEIRSDHKCYNSSKKEGINSNWAYHIRVLRKSRSWAGQQNLVGFRKLNIRRLGTTGVRITRLRHKYERI